MRPGSRGQARRKPKAQDPSPGLEPSTPPDIDELWRDHVAGLNAWDELWLDVAPILASMLPREDITSALRLALLKDQLLERLRISRVRDHEDVLDLARSLPAFKQGPIQENSIPQRLKPQEHRGLAHRIWSGERACERLWPAIWEMLSLIARRMLKKWSEQDREDTVAEVVSRLQKPVTLRGARSLKAFAIVACQNECRDLLRTGKVGGLRRPLPIDQEDRPVSVVDVAPTPEEMYSAELLKDKLATAFMQLSPEYQEVIRLRCIQGETPEATAKALHLQTGAAATRLCRARTELRRLTGIPEKVRVRSERHASLSDLPEPAEHASGKPQFGNEGAGGQDGLAHFTPSADASSDRGR